MDVGKNFNFKLKAGKELVENISIIAWIEQNGGGGEEGRFFLDYPEKTYEKYRHGSSDELKFNWEGFFKW